MTPPGTPPPLDRIDHVHVFVADRPAAEAWYARVLGLRRVPAFEVWADARGPLTLADERDTVHIALFERPAAPCRSTIALAVDAAGFVAWREHLAAALGRAVDAEDHGLSWSLYFHDPDGNPYEITSYDHAAIAARLRPTRT